MPGLQPRSGNGTRFPPGARAVWSKFCGAGGEERANLGAGWAVQVAAWSAASPPSGFYPATGSLPEVGAREAVELSSTSAPPGLRPSAMHRLQFCDSGALKDLGDGVQALHCADQRDPGGNVICF